MGFSKPVHLVRTSVRLQKGFTKIGKQRCEGPFSHEKLEPFSSSCIDKYNSHAREYLVAHLGEPFFESLMDSMTHLSSFGFNQQF